jgi:hypothetical protein
MRIKIGAVIGLASLVLGAGFVGHTSEPIGRSRSVEQGIFVPGLGQQRVSSERAVSKAINKLETTYDGFQLIHPRHVARFTPDGVLFTPKRGGPGWHWRLSKLGAKNQNLQGSNSNEVQPESDRPDIVHFDRGSIVEQYIARANSVEQQFVISEMPVLADENLVIEGEVASTGVFEQTRDGWLWRDDSGVVSLGDVRVFDAEGQHLPATMEATESSTRIVVDGRALAMATYPVTVDPEIGTNDFRISDMGGTDGVTTFDAIQPAVAYNSTDNEYLVVWAGDDDTAPLVVDELEIFGQLIDASNGSEIGSDFRISDMGPDGDTSYGASNPEVAFNSTNN